MYPDPKTGEQSGWGECSDKLFLLEKLVVEAGFVGVAFGFSKIALVYVATDHQILDPFIHIILESTVCSQRVIQAESETGIFQRCGVTVDVEDC